MGVADRRARGRRLPAAGVRLAGSEQPSRPPAPVQAGGQTADLIDQQHSEATHLPLALAILVTTTVVILLRMTGSVVLPIKALVMKLLTISAAFGLLVPVFQDGRLAALLFVIAIGAFVSSQIVFIKQLGFGTAMAVLIDATLVRALLVPSLMRLLGDRSWWAPAPLARLHRRTGLGEGVPA